MMKSVQFTDKLTATTEACTSHVHLNITWTFSDTDTDLFSKARLSVLDLQLPGVPISSCTQNIILLKEDKQSSGQARQFSTSYN